ncbi:MAG TPA: phosphopantetheine-binding protein, partial [Gemmatimonadaceae bacterium]|nr:phosphopantetheine-binding protein [Gemmatimonadaceae bacterium]
AYVVASSAPPPRPAELQARLRQQLPDYLVPSAFVLLDALPVGPNGKLDRAALPAPATTRERADGYVAPRTPLERTLAETWAAVLGLERVGIHDDFFTELGGHSLRAAQLVARLHDVLGEEVPLRSVFETPTVARLAQALVERRAGQAGDEELARMLAEIRGLSAEDVRRLLETGESLSGDQLDG